MAEGQQNRGRGAVLVPSPLSFNATIVLVPPERNRLFSRYHELRGAFPLERRDEYRRFAEGCIELARHQETPQERAILLQMALIWSRLAERAAAFASDEVW